MIMFYGASGSPYVWRVWFALEHKQASYEMKMLSFSAGDLRAPSFVALNPRRKVPVVVDGDIVVYESAAIVEYLEDRFPSPAPPLFPPDIGKRAIARRLIREIDEYLARALESMLEEVLFKPPEEWIPTAIDRVRGNFVGELARFENYAPQADFFIGEPGVVDHALYPLIALALRLERRKSDLAIRPAIGARLVAWMRRVEALPYFAKTFPPHWKES